MSIITIFLRALWCVTLLQGALHGAEGGSLPDMTLRNLGKQIVAAITYPTCDAAEKFRYFMESQMLSLCLVPCLHASKKDFSHQPKPAPARLKEEAEQRALLPYEHELLEKVLIALPELDSVEKHTIIRKTLFMYYAHVFIRLVEIAKTPHTQTGPMGLRRTFLNRYWSEPIKLIDKPLPAEDQTKLLKAIIKHAPGLAEQEETINNLFFLTDEEIKMLKKEGKHGKGVHITSSRKGGPMVSRGDGSEDPEMRETCAAGGGGSGQAPHMKRKKKKK